MLSTLGCQSQTSVRVLKRDLLHFQPGISQDYALDQQGKRVPVDVFKKRLEKSTQPDDGIDHILVRQKEHFKQGEVTALQMALIALEQQQIILGETKITIIKEEVSQGASNQAIGLVKSIDFHPVQGQNNAQGVSFLPSKSKRITRVTFVEWGEEDAGDQVVEINWQNTGIITGFSCVAVELWAKEADGKLGQTFYLSALKQASPSNQTDSPNDSPQSLTVLFWDESMTDQQMRAIILPEDKAWYEVWSLEGLLKGYQIQEDGSVGEKILDINNMTAYEELWQMLEDLEAIEVEQLLNELEFETFLEGILEEEY